MFAGNTATNDARNTAFDATYRNAMLNGEMYEETLNKERELNKKESKTIKE